MDDKGVFFAFAAKHQVLDKSVCLLPGLLECSGSSGRLVGIMSPILVPLRLCGAYLWPKTLGDVFSVCGITIVFEFMCCTRVFYICVGFPQVALTDIPHLLHSYVYIIFNFVILNI